MSRRATHQLTELGVDALAVALKSIDIELGAVRLGAAAGTADAVAEALFDGRSVELALEVKAYCTGAVARELIARSAERPREFVPMLVTERATAEARDLLNQAGWSWLDRRGRIHLRARGIRVDAEVPQDSRVAGPSPDRSVVSSRGGIAVAYWFCSHPGRTLSPTRDAADLHVAPSTVSNVVRRLADAGLVGEEGFGVFPELFFELASAWRPPQTWLGAVPEPPHRVIGDRDVNVWRRTGTAAAAAYGAPLVATQGGPVELYVTSPVEATMAARRHGLSEPGVGPAVLIVAPTPAVVAPADPDVDLMIGVWPAAPLLAVALDLAQDRARGREILDDWDHPDAVWR